MYTAIHTISQHKCFGGRLGYYSHNSKVNGAPMRFSVYQPPRAMRGRRVPILVYLAGLTCTDETIMIKGAALRHAADNGLMLVSPDTSPRGCNLPGETDDWELGIGAGFYVDASREPWSSHYQMYSYVTSELTDVICANFPARRERQGIFGHSMGGHGALVMALRNPDIYVSVSAFAPLVAPIQSPWGEKAFSAYLGDEDREAWRAYDATELVRKMENAADRPPILIDQGMADQFLDVQLHPHVFEDACREAGYPLTLRRHEGYDHGYFFIATFMEDHIRHHAARLVGPGDG
ncbi:MAG: S-formylglutathione hydrolase [Alphaproteobacteria bacterium]